LSRIEPDPAPPTFTDGEDPTRYLAPAEPEEPHDPLTVFEEAVDFIDPGAWVMKAVTEICGANPIEDVLELVGGDWRAFARTGHVYESLGRAFEAIGWNLKSGNASMDGYWSGNAADDAWTYVDTIADRAIRHKAPLEEIASNYRQATHAAYAFARAAGPIGAMLIDEVIVAGIAAAAGAVTAETGVGAGIGFGVAALTSMKVVHDADRMFKLMGEADVVIRAVQGAIQNQLADLDHHALRQLQAASLAETMHTPMLPGSY
jgi:hypothetical protein